MPGKYRPEPQDSTAVIVCSCVAGALVIVIVGIIIYFYCEKKHENRYKKIVEI